MSETTKEEAIAKVAELIKEINVAMLTTIDNGHLRSRPMATQRDEFDGTLWFMTSTKTHKIEEIRNDNRVNVSYSEPDDHIFVSVSGKAEVVTDRAKIEEFWNPAYKAWFPEGLEDPTICLMKIDVEQAEYWDSSASMLVHLVGFVKAIATGTPAKGADNEKVSM